MAKPIRLGVTGLSGRVMAGTLNAAGDGLNGREDVTSDFLVAVMDKLKFHGGAFDIKKESGEVDGTVIWSPPLPKAEDLPLPWWAEGYAGGTFQIRSQLATKDGRRHGNGVIYATEERENLETGKGYRIFFVVTDAGQMLNLNLEELVELFFNPRYVMKEECMEELLSRVPRAAE